MTVDPTSAVNAYIDTVRNANSGGMAPRDTGDTPGFGDMLQDVARAATEATRTSETASVQALQGNADVTQVVTALTNAELALQTVVAVRDRVIQAYQEISRMPI